jgi:hypothetical protein
MTSRVRRAEEEREKGAVLPKAATLKVYLCCEAIGFCGVEGYLKSLPRSLRRPLVKVKVQARLQVLHTREISPSGAPGRDGIIDFMYGIEETS